MRAVWLTTVDNKWNPFTHTDEWMAFDDSHEYGCSSIVARLAVVDDDMLPSERNQIIEAAIDKFLFADPTGLYCKAVDNNNSELDF
jgi:hypothetical protein